MTVLSPLLSLALLAPVPLQEEPPAAVRALVPAAELTGVELVFLANEGFLLRSAKHAVLIDAFLKEPYDLYDALPRSVYERLVRAEPPFDGPTTALVSHRHQDHFQAHPAAKFLTRHASAQLYSSEEVVALLSKQAPDFAAFEARVKTVTPEVGKPVELELADGVRVTFLRLEHSGENNKEIQNLGHVISFGELDLLHVGDAETNFESFRPLAGRTIDVAILPYWYFGSEQGRELIAEVIRPRVAVAAHIPPQGLDRFEKQAGRDFPEVVFFRKALESRVFEPPAGAPSEEAPDGESGH